MKVWVVTHCAAEESGTPVVTTSKEKAVEIMREMYNNTVEDFSYAILSNDIWETRAEITYTDDTYTIYEIFECEVEEG